MPRLVATRGRLATFIAAAVVVGAPAAGLQAFCVGRACDAAATARDRTPFCSLPSDVRAAVQRGFYEPRSGEVMAISRKPVRQAASGGLWPSISGAPPPAPVVFAGRGVAPGPLPAGTGIEDVAPTIAEIIGLERPHPEVRSGRSLAEAPAASPPRMVLEVVWRDVDSVSLQRSLDDLPNLARLVDAGASTFSAGTRSLPHDPAALVTTIGTGGLPSEHGIVGEILRDDRGRVASSWRPGSPQNVIATLGDHLDELTGNRAVIAGVGTTVSDRGVIGGRWYPGGDRDPFVIEESTQRQVEAAKRLLRERGFAEDDTVDLLALVQSGSPTQLDEALGELVAEARRVARGSVLVVVTGTGATRSPIDPAIPSSKVVSRIESAVDGPDRIIERARFGSFFLDQDLLAREELSDDVVLGPLLALGDNGEPVFADVFPAIAVTFARYCDG